MLRWLYPTTRERSHKHRTCQEGRREVMLIGEHDFGGEKAALAQLSQRPAAKEVKVEVGNLLTGFSA